MDDVEKIKRHLGRPVPIPLENQDGVKDVFYFKPLNVEQQAILVEINRSIKSNGMIKVKGKEIPKVSKQNTTDIFDLIYDICKHSFPSLDEEMLNEFANNNFNQISNNLDKLIRTTKKKGEVDLIKRMKEAQSNATKSTN